MSAALSIAEASPLPPAPVARVHASLRPVVADDAAAVAAIYNASLRSPPYQPDGVTADQGARWLAGVMATVRTLDAPPVAHYLGPMSVPMAQRLIAVHHLYGRPMLAATVDGETAGWAGTLGLHERPGLSPLLEFSYYVAPRWRGQGIGTQLVQHLMALAPGLQVDRLLATVWSDNHPSLAVLRRLGFQTWGVLPGAVLAFGKRRDYHLLGLVLPGKAG